MARGGRGGVTARSGPRLGPRPGFSRLFRPARFPPGTAPVGAGRAAYRERPRGSRSGLVVFPAGPWLPSPLSSVRDPPGPTPPGRNRSAAPPAASRRHAVPFRPRGLPAGPGLEPPLAPARGSCRPPVRSRRGRCPDAPQSSGQRPAGSSSYGCRRRKPPRHQQLFPDFFHKFFPAARARHFRRQTP